MTAQTQPAGQYAFVNGLNMYYEIHGSGNPLVLVHGGGSTIMTTYGHILPELAANFMVIAVETQSHGRTKDVDRAYSFGQDADDIAALLQHLQIGKASVMGFSNGGNTALQVGIRHPQLVDKLVIVAAFYKRSGMQPWFWEMMERGSFADMPQLYKDAYLELTQDPEGLYAMYTRDSQRMLTFKDWKADDIRSIQAPALVMAGDRDVMTPEHTMELCALLPKGRLAILPGAHGECIGEILTARPGSVIPQLTTALIIEFLTNTEVDTE